MRGRKEKGGRKEGMGGPLSEILNTPLAVAQGLQETILEGSQDSPTGRGAFEGVRHICRHYTVKLCYNDFWALM